MIAEDHPTAIAVRALVDKHCRDGHIHDLEGFKAALAASVRDHVSIFVGDHTCDHKDCEITVHVRCDTSEALEYIHYAKTLVLRRIGH